ncbi:MAG: hypothetical protein WB797_16540, partial [Nocardioides sp.]
MRRRVGLIACVSAALLVGATMGPTVAQAAVSGLVRIQGGGSHHVAKVTSKGKLSVTDGTAQTKAHQLETTVASPGQAVNKLGSPTCASGGFYKVPAKKALIITGAVFYNHPNGAGDDEQDLFIGPASTPCTSFVAAGVSNGEHATLPQAFSPGIPVPAGYALGEASLNDSGTVMIYGYLVPASA